MHFLILSNLDRLLLSKQCYHRNVIYSICRNKKRWSIIKQFSKSLNCDNIKYLESPKKKSKLETVHSKTILVVLVGWLGAKERYLNKYVQLYHNRNIDVLRVQTRWVDILYPYQTLVPNVKRLIESFKHIETIYPNIIFHTLSSGNYFYASVIDEIIREPKLVETMSDMIKGVIFDSFIDWSYVLSNRKALDVALDTSLNILPNDLFSKVYASRNTCPLTLRVSPSKLHFYHKKNLILQENPLLIPSLLLFSRIDPLSDMNANFRLAERWHKNGILVSSKCWPDSPHVQLYRMHPNEYGERIDSFIEQVMVNHQS
ncbi:hypothetical protein BLOT_016456 [Blomia tropicalis]|nr:hypothetical protein BLOT_016456 [Blomia tropicalis]